MADKKIHITWPILFSLLFVLVLLNIYLGIFVKRNQLTSSRPAPTLKPKPFVTAGISSPAASPTAMIVDTTINLSNLKPNSVIKNPLTISGKVDSGWFFEGRFPVKITDINGLVITQSLARETVPGSWTQPGFHNFSVTFNIFSTPAVEGYVVFESDNPSGLPRNQKHYSLPVKFKSTTSAPAL